MHLGFTLQGAFLPNAIPMVVTRRSSALAVSASVSVAMIILFNFISFLFLKCLTYRQVGPCIVWIITSLFNGLNFELLGHFLISKGANIREIVTFR